MRFPVSSGGVRTVNVAVDNCRMHYWSLQLGCWCCCFRSYHDIAIHILHTRRPLCIIIFRYDVLNLQWNMTLYLLWHVFFSWLSFLFCHHCLCCSRNILFLSHGSLFSGRYSFYQLKWKASSEFQLNAILRFLIYYNAHCTRVDADGRGVFECFFFPVFALKYTVREWLLKVGFSWCSLSNKH